MPPVPDCWCVSDSRSFRPAFFLSLALRDADGGRWKDGKCAGIGRRTSGLQPRRKTEGRAGGPPGTSSAAGACSGTLTHGYNRRQRRRSSCVRKGRPGTGCRGIEFYRNHPARGPGARLEASIGRSVRPLGSSLGLKLPALRLDRNLPWRIRGLFREATPHDRFPDLTANFSVKILQRSTFQYRVSAPAYSFIFP